MRFDWYQGTIYDDHPSIIRGFSGYFSSVAQDADRLAETYRYKTGYTLRNEQTGDEVKVFAGGHNGKHGTHFIASGDNAIIVSEAVRRLWADSHHVTRADACQDMHGPELFTALRKKYLRIAKKYRIAAKYETDALNTLAGSTQYLGATSSDYRSRLYQKGLQLRAEYLAGKRNSPVDQESLINGCQYELPDGSKCDLADLVRVEVQIRPPTKEGKLALAHLEPEKCLAFSPWLVDLADSVFGMKFEKLDIRGQKVSDLDHKITWMLKQYGNSITELIDSYGPEGVGKYLEHRLSLMKTGNK